MAASSSAVSTADTLASIQSELASIREASDTFWLLFAGSLVFFMQCGFGMLEAGAVRSKSTQNIMLKNLFDASIGGILWWLIGFGLANEGGSSFIGLVPTGNRTGSYFATAAYSAADSQADYNLAATGVEWATVFFQFTFAATSATIVSGAVAERAQLPAYLFAASLITGIVYPTVAHWVWSSEGWLSVHNPSAVLGGMVDFAGSGVVHMTGGTAALVGAAVIGPRLGRFDVATGAVVLMPGHSAVLQVRALFARFSDDVSCTSCFPYRLTALPPACVPRGRSSAPLSSGLAGTASTRARPSASLNTTRAKQGGWC